MALRHATIDAIVWQRDGQTDLKITLLYLLSNATKTIAKPASQKKRSQKLQRKIVNSSARSLFGPASVSNNNNSDNNESALKNWVRVIVYTK